MKSFDLAVIGGGPGGFSAALEGAALGAYVVLVEKEHVGGVCLHAGCIPTKTLLASAELCHTIQRAEQFGLKARFDGVDFPAVYKRKDDVIATLNKGMLFQLKRAGVALINSEAVLKDAHTLVVNDNEIEARKIIIATGSKPKSLSFCAVNGTSILNSKQLLERSSFPKKLIVLGGGYIGCEFASLAHDFGAEVTIIEALPSILTQADTDIVKRLTASFKRRGIRIITGDTVVTVDATDNHVDVTTASGTIISAEAVLVAIGREAALFPFDTAVSDIAIDRGCICVSEYLETTTSGVYAIGDVLSSPQLAHVASYEGRIAAYNAVNGNQKKVSYDVVPYGIYTRPEIASIGRTQKDCVSENDTIASVRYLYSAVGKAHCMNETEGLVQLFYAGNSKRVCGATIMGAHATDIIAEIGVALTAELRVDALAETIHAHPAIGELIQEAALEAAKK